MYSNLPQVLQFMSYADKRDHEKAFDSDHAGVEQNPTGHPVHGLEQFSPVCRG